MKEIGLEYLVTKYFDGKIAFHNFKLGIKIIYLILSNYIGK